MSQQPAPTPRYALALCAIYGQPPSRSTGLCLLDQPGAGDVRLVRHPRIEPGLLGAEVFQQGTDLVLAVYDEFMSSQHAVLRRDPGGRFRAEDLGSKNGTRLDGVPLLHGSRPLRHGDLIETGRTLWCFQVLQRGSAEQDEDDERDRVYAQAPRTLHPFWPATLNPALRRVFGVMSRLGEVRSPVLIHGEPGTGKRWLSHYLHERYGGAGQMWVVAPGERLPAAGSLGEGTLLVEEVGRLSMDDQQLLMHLLRGDARHHAQRLWVLATTDAELEVLAGGGAFRPDLLSRLSAVMLRLPALRERKEDLGLLIEFFLTQQQGSQSTYHLPEMSAEVWRRLFSYDWPGNQTELRAALRHAVYTAWQRDRGPIQIGDLPEAVQRGQGGPGLPNMSTNSVPPAWMPVVPKTPYRAPGQEPVLKTITLGPGADREARRLALIAALEAEGGKVARAARRLGISRVHVHRLTKQLGVNPDDYRARRAARDPDPDPGEDD